MNEKRVLRIADARCQARHPSVYDSRIIVGPGGGNPTCDECIREVRAELKSAHLAGALGVTVVTEQRERMGFGEAIEYLKTKFPDESLPFLEARLNFLIRSGDVDAWQIGEDTTVSRLMLTGIDLARVNWPAGM